VLACIHVSIHCSKRPKVHADIPPDCEALRKAAETNLVETLLAQLKELSELDDKPSRKTGTP
jgi:hypothetical protein